MDPSATNGIDPQLGESDLPPFPPFGAFEIRFDLAPYTGQPLSSYKDYRYLVSWPYLGTREHTLWWQVTTPGISSINITYDLPAFAILRITDNITGTLLNLGPFTGQGVATIPASYTAFATKALLIMEYTWLPVELTSFTASVLQNEKAVQLNWLTATETNNSGFEILRFTQNDNDWKTIGFVPGFGTTTEPKSYSFTDNLSLTLTLNLTHTLRYRLKQIDFDGSFEYSNEIEVAVDFSPKEFVMYQNYPNPFNPSTTIKFTVPSVIANGVKQSQFVTLKVYDILGNEVATLVNEEKQPGVYEVEFNINSGEVRNLPSGVYFYQLIAKGPETSSGQSFVQTKKMLLLK